jgi:hypothetical protein
MEIVFRLISDVEPVARLVADVDSLARLDVLRVATIKLDGLCV